LKLPPDNRLRTPPVTPWAISLLKPTFIASYVVGGVVAELGGGKSANGGMSAAFSRMFNDFGNAEFENSGEKTSSG
jgi:hypothetical protein